MDLFERHEKLTKKGYYVTVDPVSQEYNLNMIRIEEGEMPLVTFTGYILNSMAETVQVVSSCDTYKDALEEAIEYVENVVKSEGSVEEYARCVEYYEKRSADE